MGRLKPLTAELLNQEQKDLLNEIQSGPRGQTLGDNALVGPFGVWVRVPEIGNPIQALGEAIRFNSPLDDQVREIIICTVGSFYKARFEVAVHLQLALKYGADEKQLMKLCRDEVPNFPKAQQVAYQLAIEMLKNKSVSSTSYKRATTFFSEEELISIVATVGYYCLVSHTLNTFNIPLEPDMKEPF